VPRCASVRRETGIIASSGLSGSSPRSWSQVRSAPAQTATNDVVDGDAEVVLDLLDLVD